MNHTKKNRFNPFYGKQLFSAFNIYIYLAITSTLIFSASPSKSQSVSVSLNADSNIILIGDFLHIKQTITFPAGTYIKLPILTDTIGNMEIVRSTAIDSFKEGKSIKIEQTIIASAYDSGNYRAGPVKIYFTNGKGSTDSTQSNVLLIRVNTIPVDTAKAFKEIKGPLQVPYHWQEFLPLIAGGILLLAILTVIILYIRHVRKKSRQQAPESIMPEDPAHIWAMKELKKLEEDHLWQNDRVKNYYSRLSEILRLYLEYRYRWFALEATTSEIAEQINAFEIPGGAKKNLMMILRNADMVKFAKVLPSPDTNMLAMSNAFSFIEQTKATETSADTNHV